MHQRTGSGHKGRQFLVRQSLHGDFVRSIVDQLDGNNPREAYLLQHLLSKYADPDPKSAESRRKAAIEKLMAVEELNTATNTRLLLGNWALDESQTPEELIRIGNSTMSGVLTHAADLIRRLIGGSVPRMVLNGSFSGGASTSKRRGPGMVARKYSGKSDVTLRAWDAIWPHLLGDKLWLSLNSELLQPRFVDGSDHFTVPKNDTIDRNACKEPDLNMYFQKAVGNFIRHRLRKRAKIDLNRQQVNQELARIAWGSGLATIDLSSASDSVAYRLVERLLPAEWFYYMDDLRSRGCWIDDTFHEFAMFSSMGNGFTFELESLIFWALATATVSTTPVRGLSRTVSVYGDDIIIHRSHYHRLRRVLSYCGFIVNSKKSHFSGPIRESCGKHYHRRVDVTPFYIKKPIRNVEDLIHHLNAVRKWSTTGRVYGHTTLYPVWATFSKHVPAALHGGWDCDTVETLASPSGPAKRLCRTSTERKIDQIGSYLKWLDEASTAKPVVPKPMTPTGEFWWEPRTKSATAVSVISETHFFVRGRLPSWNRACPVFIDEVMTPSRERTNHD